ncbi:PREDICTED: uncharacterized protein LOC109183798 [Ipomoea nil]|uniref:uncharacterized protein LOC109183798 n=1 Tax=Ipomoea nil TaxID=35883 RepID=UPI0009011445|nr:PREDICTED: uncharacterized protein LOC109183798 [Ipomoea nil]
MVSERHRSYATVVTAETETGDENGGDQATSSDQIPMNPSPVQRVEEFHDPMYLHVTENPNLVLVSPPLSEVNYATWSRSMRIALEVKNTYGFLDGSIVSPGESDPRFPIWRRCNNIVCSWLFKSLSPTIAEGVLYFEVATEIWSVLRRRYFQVDAHRIAELQNEIYSKIQKEKQEDQIIRFLEGLNEEYENIKSGILVMDPIPVMEKNSDDQTVVAAATSFNKRKFNNNSGKSVPKCTFCGKLGHTIEKCYKKHGFPPGWILGYKSKDKQAQDSQQTSTASVNQVGDVGLTAEQFQRLVTLLQNQGQGSYSSNNAVVTLSNTGTNSDFRKTTEKHTEGKSILNPHVNTVLDSLDVWILDSGATDHITCSLDYFESYYDVHGILVKLPNGETVNVTHMGDIRLHMDILLKNVLFIPSFSFNIVSASKLVRQSRYEIIIGADYCNIQGHLWMVLLKREEDCT